MKESMKLSNYKKSDILVGLYVNEDALEDEKQFNNTVYSVTTQKNQKVDLLVFHKDLSEEKLGKIKSILDEPVATYKKVNEKGEQEVEERKAEETVNYKLINTESSSFSELFNELFYYAHENEYKFFSIMEQEDVFSLNWFDYVKKISEEKEDVGAFSPLIRHTVNGHFQGIINEIPWVEGVAEEAGVTDINILLKAENSVNILGCTFKVDEFVEHLPEDDNGGVVPPIKESMKLVNAYEFFLRMIYDDLKIFAIPRNGYELNLKIKDYYDPMSSKIPSNVTQIPKEKGGLTQDEAKFYIDLARKEYFFEEDRNIQYEA